MHQIVRLRIHREGKKFWFFCARNWWMITKDTWNNYQDTLNIKSRKTVLTLSSSVPYKTFEAKILFSLLYNVPLFAYHLKRSENQRFFDIFREYKKSLLHFRSHWNCDKKIWPSFLCTLYDGLEMNALVRKRIRRQTSSDWKRFLS